MADEVFKFTAELCSRTYEGTRNRFPNPEGTEPPAATHGAYGSNGNWIGMVLLPVTLMGKIITSVRFTMTANTAGTNANKSIHIFSSNHQTTDAVGKGSSFPKEELGYIEGAFRGRTTVVDLSSSLLENVASYYSSGGRMLVLYDPTNAAYSSYCRFTQIKIEVHCAIPTPKKNTVKIKVNGQWKECEVLYKKDKTWHQCVPFYMDKGIWRECTFP